MISLRNFLAYSEFDNTPNNGGWRKDWGPHVSDFGQGDPTWGGGQGQGIMGAINYLSGVGMQAFSFLTMNVIGDDQIVFSYVSDQDYFRFIAPRLHNGIKSLIMLIPKASSCFSSRKRLRMEPCWMEKTLDLPTNSTTRN